LFFSLKQLVSTEIAQSHERELTNSLLKNQKLLLVLDLDKTLLHATTDAEKLTPNPVDKGSVED